MGLRLEDRWVWDFWLARVEGAFHIFYLQAPRSLGDPDLRHVNATVGHAVSNDLTEWTVLPDALVPGDHSSWDGLATWTGSVIGHRGLWHMFYTGVSRRDGVVSQRVGSATSDDLTTWHKSPSPVIEPDGRWYETHRDHDWYEEAWRDPWVFRGHDGRFHALITARANAGDPRGRGVIGHASSDDLSSWNVEPPLSEPGEFGHLEVPQITAIDGRYVLVFSCDAERVAPGRRQREGLNADATYVLGVDSELGPYDVGRARPALSHEFYSGRIVHDTHGEPVWLAFRNVGPDGGFPGELSDPMPVDPRLWA